jgi:DNA-binding CsgD family transcriptional regulator
MGPGGTQEGGVAVNRRGGHLSPAEREELGFAAYEMAVKKRTYRQIAAELGINKDTVAGLLREEGERRRVEHLGQIHESVAAYDAVEKEAWERLAAFPNARGSMVVVGLLNNILAARTRKDLIFGLEAPKKTDVRQRTERWDYSRLSAEELDLFEQIIKKIAGVEEAGDEKAEGKRAVIEGGS